MSQWSYGLLLKDRRGYKETSLLKNFTKWAAGKTHSEKMVLAGSLLQVLTDTEVATTADQFIPPLNYKVLTDFTVKLMCIPAWVHPLTDRQKELLLAVTSYNIRVEVYHKVE